MTDENKNDKEIIARLTEENAQWRRNHHEAKVIIRQRAPNINGLSFKSSITTILNERDETVGKVDFFREEIKSMLQVLISSEASDKQKVDQLKQRINTFLFKNKI